MAAGLVAGLVLVQAARGALSTVLFGIAPNDPASLVAAAAVLLGAALVASLPPAWSAMRVDPAEGLRVE